MIDYFKPSYADLPHFKLEWQMMSVYKKYSLNAKLFD